MESTAPNARPKELSDSETGAGLLQFLLQLGNVKFCYFLSAAPLEEFTSCYRPQDIAKNKLWFQTESCLSEALLCAHGAGRAVSESPEVSLSLTLLLPSSFQGSLGPHESPQSPRWSLVGRQQSGGACLWHHDGYQAQEAELRWRKESF